MFFTYSSRNRHLNQYKQLKKIVKKFPTLWKFLTWLKDRLIDLSRLIDVLMMMILFHFWPEQTYRFSTRKFIPTKKNRFSKESRPIIPYDLVKSKSSSMPMIKEINVIGRGSSFNINNIKEMKGPIFLASFWAPLRIDVNGNVFLVHRTSYGKERYKEAFTDEDLDEYFEDKIHKNFKNKNITYVIARKNLVERFKKDGHNVLGVILYTVDDSGNLHSLSKEGEETPEYLKLIDHVQYKLISMVEKIYKPPLLAPHPNFAPSGSFLQVLSALSYTAEKINVYGWDFYLDKSPANMNYWQLFFNMYKIRPDLDRSKYHFESALINFYYGYQLSKLSNFNIHSYMGQLGKHEKLIKKIERVLFN